MTTNTRIFAALLIACTAFICGLCDRTSNLEYLIENNTDSDIEIRMYGLSSDTGEKKDSTNVLENNEQLTLWHEEQMGQVSKSPRATIYFLDSLIIRRIKDNVRSPKTFLSLGEWAYIKHDDYHAEHRLIIADDDF